MAPELRRCWIVLPAYLACGLILGLADPLLGREAVRLGLRPGMATAASVNLLMPLAAAALAAVHGRIVGAWVGAVLMTLGFVAGLAVQYSGAVRDWSPLGVLASVPPVLAAACFGYAAVGTAVALAAAALRRPKPPATTPPGAP